MNKPTKDELKAWDKLLQEEGLGMERGHNSTRLNYGFEEGKSLARTWEDVKVYTRRKRKTHSRSERTCVVCGGLFPARADAKCCPRPKICRLKLQRRK
jgi:hypothetical protein